MAPDHRLDPEQHALLERLASELKEPVPLSDRVERGVIGRLQAGSLSRANRRWYFGRPVVAAAIAAGIAAVFALGVLVGRRSTVPTAVDSELHSIEFVLRTTADSAVALVGDFNDWDPRATPLRPTSDSVWTVVVGLRPGRYRYTFIVDGSQWRRDPLAPRALEDDFGAPTSVITVAQR